ncbi:hypothetical protein EBH_0027580 [Eimeria brunetti]|uniref:Uncharacterized protein n=1 Tax=Eimeria brunetti TaxID=51314 RepID=U6LPA6_9EIME|nr:hypothetical protein EBH_0027580 [Eimeria brunetti]
MEDVFVFSGNAVDTLPTGLDPNNCSGPNWGRDGPTRSGNHSRGQRGAPASVERGGAGVGRVESQDTTDHPWGGPPPYSPTDPFGPPMEAVFGPPPPYSPGDYREGRRRRGLRLRLHGPPSPREPSGARSDPRRSDLVYLFPRIDDPQAKLDLNAIMGFFADLRSPHHGRRHGMFTVIVNDVLLTIKVWENNLENIGRALEAHILNLVAGFGANPDAGFTDLAVKFVTESDGATSGDVGMSIHVETDDEIQDECMPSVKHPLKAFLAQALQFKQRLLE